MEKFKVGDLVRCTSILRGNTIGPTEGETDYKYLGKIGIILVVGGTHLIVNFDKNREGKGESMYIWRFELVPPITKEERLTKKIQLLSKRFYTKQMKKGRDYHALLLL